MTNTIHTARGDFTIRPTRESDADAFRALRLQALRDHPEAFASDYEENLVKPREFWVERMTNSDMRMTFVAEHVATRALGAITGIYRATGAKVCHAADIWGVYVRPEWRGLTLGEKLINACVAWAREHEVRIVRLSVTTTNRPAIQCYQRCGFVQTGVAAEYIFANEQYHDEFLMTRRMGGICD